MIQSTTHFQYRPQLQPNTGRKTYQPASQPRFQGLGPDAISSFISDTIGVWLPKMPFVRTKTQFFEDTFLEFVEDGAFYFTVPLASEYLLSKIFHRFCKLDSSVTRDAIGTAYPKLTGTISKQLIAAKAGTLLGALALAGGFEYMVQHAKNVITAHHFKTKNFTAVAGLEEAKVTANGEEDPVEKAKRRAFQVGGITLGLLGASFGLSKLILNSNRVEELARGVLKYFDFGVKKTFDLSKPLLAILIATGVVSYLDAARGTLEKKETATRLAFVVPYLLFGKQLAGNILAWLAENSTIRHGDLKFKINDHVKFLDKSLLFRENFLDFNAVRDSISKEVEALTLHTDQEINRALKDKILNRFFTLENRSYVLGALTMGAGLCMLIYHQTQERFKQEKAQREKQAQRDLSAVKNRNLQVPQGFHSFV